MGVHGRGRGTDMRAGARAGAGEQVRRWARVGARERQRAFGTWTCMHVHACMQEGRPGHTGIVRESERANVRSSRVSVRSADERARAGVRRHQRVWAREQRLVESTG
ncbi:hypothetical protein CDL15_Pgr026215 [Punica granatum]|uniref:Uncharacterized protein n=1 Tax=Punica granatum TaxID=22663 RepID=A0A218VSQ0_PUNGR|nr:hypothetical protein CDL15_Pgr026215 [Punica granatum]PKI78488.1 hypothetical protein CRG98_001128 [Punica granatum]